MSRSSRQRRAETEARAQQADERQATASPTPSEQPPAPPTADEALTPLPLKHGSQVITDRALQAGQITGHPTPPPPPTPVADLAVEIFGALAHANRTAHALATLDDSGEIREAIDAIGRAKRLVSARYPG